MKRASCWVVFLMVLLLSMGTFTTGFAAPDPAEPTRDTRELFGHDVEGLKPVTLIYASDGAFNSLGDALLVNLVKLVAAESKGKIKIDAHRHGSLYRTNDFPKVMPIGTIHMGGINKGLLMSRENGYAPWIIAYVWKSPEHPVSVVCSPEWYEMEDRLAAKKWNLKPLIGANLGNWDYWSSKEIKSMDDFRGKRVWSYGELSNAYIAAWGGTPVMKSFGEMYMAYYKGALDIVSSSIGLYHDYKFFEAGKYRINMPTYPPGSINIHYYDLYMNRDKWNSLPTAYKKIMLDAVDLMGWAGTFEGLCMERLHEYRLYNQYGVKDMAISTKNPKEYKKICDAAVEAGKKFVFKRGATQEQWDFAQSMLKKYGDDKHTSRYTWWFKKAWGEADRRVAEIEKALKAGKTWDEAYDVYAAKHRYAWSVEKIKTEWMNTPRIKWDWKEETRLK